MPSKKTLRPERLEVRCTPTVVCNANPTYEAECNYLDNLITPSMITDTAVQSGNWSNPATWSNGVPGNGANVWIPNGRSVAVDGEEPGSLHSILDNGLLTFATNVNTSLLVDTIVVGTDNNPTNTPEGELDIGTTANPIQTGVTATITFADDGTLTQAWANDPSQLARGLISMNTVSIVGSFVTPYETATGTAAGSNTITLSSVPAGWSVSDTLLFPGTSPTANQDEQIAIAAINGNTVTLASPLVYSHTAPAGDSVYVADEHRNVVFQSQNTTDYERFGHIMFMHTDQETVQNAALLNLGRTDKSLPLGATNPDGTKNVVGRYALHFHRDYWPTMSANDPRVLVSGNFELGSPGWGYDNHSSNVDMEDNVAFDNNGAGFVTEAGNEIGTFNANLAVRTTGVANGTDPSVNSSRTNIDDFGFTGSGFWMQSPSCTLTNNIALDDTTGFYFYNDPLKFAGALLLSWDGQNIGEVPFPLVSGNISAEAVDGLQVADNTGGSTINDFTAWDVVTGVDFNYSAFNLTLANSSLTAIPGSLGDGIHTNGAGYSESVNAINDVVSGFALGFAIPGRGTNTISGGTWNVATGFEITSQNTNQPNRLIQFSNVAFGPAVTTQYQWDAQNLYEGEDPNSDFVPQQVYINGVEAYFSNQGAAFIPFPSGYVNMPAALDGLTNAQLMATYGLAMEGEIASGQPQAAPFYYGLDPYAGSLPEVSKASYTLSYYTPEGVVTEPTPITLQPGWNLITRIVDGAPHSWIVGYDAPTAPPPPGNTINGTQTINGAKQLLPLTTTTNGSVIQVTATSSQGASLTDLTIVNSGVEWDVVVASNGALFIEGQGKILKTLMINASNTYSIAVSLDTSTSTLSVVINGTKYL